MNQQELLEYLGRLLGRSITADDWVKLSSGQRARFAGWLMERGITYDSARAALASPFQPVAFLNDDKNANRSLAPAAVVETCLKGDSAGLRIGIDIQRIDELFSADIAFDPKASSELKAIFTLREISYAQSRPKPLETLAGLFAAKEALRKSDAALLSRSLPELEVLPDAAGGPEFAGFSLSISHSGGFAIAVAAALETQLPQPAATHPANPIALMAPTTAVLPSPKGSWGKMVLVAVVVVFAVLVVQGIVFHAFGVSR